MKEDPELLIEIVIEKIKKNKKQIGSCLEPPCSLCVILLKTTKRREEALSKLISDLDPAVRLISKFKQVRDFK